MSHADTEGSEVWVGPADAVVIAILEEQLCWAV